MLRNVLAVNSYLPGAGQRRLREWRRLLFGRGGSYAFSRAFRLSHGFPCDQAWRRQAAEPSMDVRCAARARVVEAGQYLPQQRPEAFADAVMKVREWLI